MTLDDLIKNSNTYTDETPTTSQGLAYANEAIATINNKLGLVLPLFEDSSTDYVALSDSWLIQTVMNWISYGVKMNDSSLDEAMIYRQKFDEALTLLGENVDLAVDELYKTDNSGGIYQLDVKEAINIGWFGQRRGKQ